MAAAATIMSNLRSELATITTANGYQLNVGLVRDDWEVPSDTPVDTGKAVVSVLDAGEPEPLGYYASTKALFELLVVVRWKIVGTFGADQTTVGMKIRADMRQLIVKPIALGSAFNYAELVGIEGIDVTDEDVTADVQMRIVYWENRGTPV